MTQVRKQQVRDAILKAGEQLFAQHGYQHTSMAAIAKLAGVATGNIYTYFPGKKELFAAIITPEFALELSRLTSHRIAAFARAGGMDPAQTMDQGQAALLFRFWLDNRNKVIILLARAQGTPFQDFAQDHVQSMLDQTLSQIPGHYPDLPISETLCFTIRRILEESIRSIVAILEHFPTEAQVAEAMALGWAYQFGGILALIERARAKAS